MLEEVRGEGRRLGGEKLQRWKRTGSDLQVSRHVGSQAAARGRPCAGSTQAGEVRRRAAQPSTLSPRRGHPTLQAATASRMPAASA